MLVHWSPLSLKNFYGENAIAISGRDFLHISLSQRNSHGTKFPQIENVYAVHQQYQMLTPAYEHTEV